MARFQIFIPADVGNLKSAEAAFTDVGLDFLQGADSQIVTDGPDGKPGRVFAWLDPTKARIGYRPDEQTWIPAAQNGDLETGRYWVGIWNDDPPTESDLRRPDHRQGEFVQLGNDESWLITAPHNLDRYPDLQPNGSINWCVDEEFNWLVTDLEKRKAESVLSAKDSDSKLFTMLFDDDRDFFFLCRLLAINYRITPEVCAHMRLFTMQPIRRIVAALMGLRLKES